jgi:acetolactate decarboxylase
MQPRRTGRCVAALLLALALILAIGGCAASGRTGVRTADVSQAPPAWDEDALIQWSTIGALTIGLYQPAVTVGAIRDAGTVGLGTFSALDGEMIELDDVVYQVRSDGSVHESPDASTSPFAAVTHFSADRTVEITGAPTFDALKQAIDAQMPNVNDIRVIRMPGHFDYVKARSVPRQSEPYPPLSDAVAEQSVFELHDVDGVLVGIWCPQWIGQINAPGYHFHFLSADKTAGGHVLDLTGAKGSVQVDITPGLNVMLPQTEAFQQVDVAGTYQQQTQAAEK